MAWYNHEKRILPTVTFVGLVIVIAVTSIGIYLLKKMRIDSVSKGGFYGLIAVLVFFILVLLVSIYSTLVYQRCQRGFLLVTVIFLTIVLGVLSFFVFTYGDKMYEWAGSLWENGDQEAIEAVESWLNCQGWDEENETSCAGVVDDFFDTNTQRAGTVLGIVFLAFMISMFLCFYMVCKNGRISRYPGGEEEMDLSSMTGGRANMNVHLNADADFH